MIDVPSSELLLRYLIYSIPALVLLVLFFLLYSGRSDTPETPGRADSDRSEPLGILHGGALRERQGAACAPGAMDTTAAVVLQTPGELLADLEQRLDAAEDDGDPVSLATIYLAVGRARIDAGLEPSGLDALRSAAGLAALHKAVELHAQARLDLAEAALRAGDPITACEHWQMARMAFIESGHKREGDKIDQRMRANGCPTDWVLTDF